MKEHQTVTDHLRRTIKVNNPPSRIVSLVPSISELIWDLSLEKELRGVTKFCVNPPKLFKTKTKVGGTKNIKFHKIDALNPDLIIANKEENTEEMVVELEKKYPVFVTDVMDYKGALRMIKDLGSLTGKNTEAKHLIEKIEDKGKAYNSYLIGTGQSKKRIAYLIWKNPWMTVGGDTFISNMMEIAGYENAFKEEQRYPEIQLETLRERNVDCVFLSSEPFPFKEKHIKEINELLPSTKVALVDGEAFSWYGSRMLHSFDYFNNLNHELSF